MDRKQPFRIGFLVTLTFALLAAFAIRLYNLQIRNANAQSNANANTFTYTTRVTAARGDVLDRNGKVLITSRASYNLVIVRDVLFSAENPNESLRRLHNLCSELNKPYTDHLPITREKPYQYTTDELSDTWKGYFRSYLEHCGWDSDISAAQLIKLMKQHYHIPSDWTEEEARGVLSLRFELDLRSDYTPLTTYVLLSDVDADSLAAIKELGTPGLNVETDTVRCYNTDYAAHILGSTGLMDSAEYAIYKEQGYAMDAVVGKDGLERAFESELHGTNGTRVTTISKDGEILQESYREEPKAGNNIELTIDIDLQQTAEESLAKLIEDLRENGVSAHKYGMDAEGGAVVAMDVKTGEILACASYPTYHLETFAQDYNALLEDKYAPLYNRALQAAYPPGSTFKMVTAIAAIDSAGIGRYRKIYDEGIYTRFEGYQPKCNIYTSSFGTQTHGLINMMQALCVSCNYYFYEIGYETGITAIDKVAKALGLGESTGQELPEEIGYRANPETKKKLFGNDVSMSGWYDADTVAASIGQSENRFTPLQMCVYTTALANEGIRYRATFLSRILSSDYQELLYETKPEVESTLDMSEEAVLAVKEGMRMAVTSGSARSVFGDYPIAVCAKTGTAQHGNTDSGSDHAAFICYAPADDPQIAIAVYVEKGAQGGNLGNVAKAILDVYFAEQTAVETFPEQNTLQ